jgi:outer membrane receptor protein involved in Fe transport
VTPRPDLNRFGGTAQAGVSTTEGGGTSYNLAAAVNAPIATDRFAVRASGFYSRDGGFVENVALGEDDVGRARIYGGRLDALFKPTDRLSVRLSGFSQNISRDGTAQVDYTLAGAPSTGDLEQRRLLREPFEQQFRVVSGTVDYELDWASFTSITSYQTNDVNYRTDASALYVPLLGLFGLPVAAAANDGGIATEKFTQEVRLASSGEGKVDWLLGAFYTDEDNTAQTALVGYNADGSLFPVNLLTASFPSTYKEKAVFGNVTVHLSDRLDVTGGLRYAENRQSYTQNATGILAPSAPRATSSEKVTTYLANARYRFSPHTIGYARFATGYRPGGPNLVTFDPLTGNPLGPPTFESDTLKSYELGLRSETSDRRFSVDASAYHIDWDDMLISGVRNGLNSFVNTGGSTIDGAEVTLTARPTSRFTVTGAFAYQDARLSADSPDLGGVDGEALPTVPDLTATVNADYRADWWGVSPTLGATVRYVSDREAGFDGNPNLPQYDLGNYTAVDLRAGATVGPVVAQLYVRNLFDERGQSAAYVALASLGGPARVTVIQPRTIGLSLTSRF